MDAMFVEPVFNRGTCSAIMCCGCFPVEVMLKTAFSVCRVAYMLSMLLMSCVKVSCSSGFCSSTCVIRSFSWFFLSSPFLCCSMKLNLHEMLFMVMR